jgi:hypothetical protein
VSPSSALKKAWEQLRIRRFLPQLKGNILIANTNATPGISHQAYPTHVARNLALDALQAPRLHLKRLLAPHVILDSFRLQMLECALHAHKISLQLLQGKQIIVTLAQIALPARSSQVAVELLQEAVLHVPIQHTLNETMHPKHLEAHANWPLYSSYINKI